MQILILNWRDIRNPAAGGAELLTHQLATRWVAAGHTVTQCSSRWPGAPAEEIVDGVRMVRAGNPMTVYWAAYRTYQRRFRGQIDLVYDEINTVPFFTPWYVREPIVAHFNQMAREIWFYECGWPLNLIGYWLEPSWLARYRRTPVITISESSRRDLVALGFPVERIAVIPMGIDHAPRLSDPPPRAAAPTLLYVGRLKCSKRVHHVIEAFARVRREIPSASLWIVGNGDRGYTERLVRLARARGVQEAVRFFGHVPESEKQALMAQAHLIAVTSIREGWGLIVTESNRYGTPSIVYRVPGLVDSTIDGINGVICPANTPEALAEQAIAILKDPARYERLSRGATESSARMTWDRAATEMLAVFRRELGEASPAATPLTVALPALGDPVHPQALEGLAAFITQWPAEVVIHVIGDQPGQEDRRRALAAAGVPASAIRAIAHDPVQGRLGLFDEALQHATSDWIMMPDLTRPWPARDWRRVAAAATGQRTVVRRQFAAASEAADVIAMTATPGRWIRWAAAPWRALIRRWFALDAEMMETEVRWWRVATARSVMAKTVRKAFAPDLEQLAVARRLGAKIVTLAGGQPAPRRPIAARLRRVYDACAIAYRMHQLRYYDRLAAGPLDAHPMVSIVIAVSRWNPMLAECLDHCLRLQYPAYEILVLPDAPFPPPDPRIRVIPTGPVHPGEKRDQGLRAARGSLIAFLDDDAVPTPRWIEHAVRHFAAPAVGAVGGPASTPAHDSWLQKAGGAIYASWMMGGSKVYRFVPQPAGAVRDLPTCNLFVRRSTLEAIGGFNTKFWPGEDTIVCSKILKNQRQRIWYDPDVLVYHHRRPLFMPHLRQLIRYAEHRGYFVKRFPANSLEIAYFLPTLLVMGFALGWMPAIIWPAWWRVYLATVATYLGLVVASGLGSLSARFVAAFTAGMIASHLAYGVFFLKGLASPRLAEGQA